MRGEPHDAFALHDAREERARAAYMAGKTCGDCGKVREPEGYENADRIGWCPYWGDFTCLDDRADEMDCGGFE